MNKFAFGPGSQIEPCYLKDAFDKVLNQVRKRLHEAIDNGRQRGEVAIHIDTTPVPPRGAWGFEPIIDHVVNGGLTFSVTIGPLPEYQHWGQT